MPYSDALTTQDKPLSSFCDAVILCAGEGLRFQRSEKTETSKIKTTKIKTTKIKTTKTKPSKLLVALKGKPALRYLCETVRNTGFARVLLVLPKDEGARKAISALVSQFLPDALLVEGGERRQDSLQKALEALERTHDNNDKNNWVMVFDAARPLVSRELIARVALRAKDLCEHSVSACVVPLLPVVDSVKRLDKQGRVCESVARADLRLAQTPQAAPHALLLRLLRNTSVTVSDEAQLCQSVNPAKASCLVEAVEGEARAHKITTLEDVGILVGLLEGVAGLRGGASIPEYPRIPEYRSATGFDIHKTREGTSLRLCGVDVPASFSLEGHSDADVVLHALTDAVLSLAGAGDIGDLFPPTDGRWRDADSALFLIRALELLHEAGGALVSLDATLLLEKPHLGRFKLAMRERLADLTGLAVERVGVKATTLEGLGALGRGEGVGSFATASARFG